MMAKFSVLNPKGLYVHCKFRKRITKFLFCAHQLQQAREIQKFHVAVVQQRLRNVQKSLMRVRRRFFCQSRPFVFLLFGVAVAETPYCCHPDILLPW